MYVKCHITCHLVDKAFREIRPRSGQFVIPLHTEISLLCLFRHVTRCIERELAYLGIDRSAIKNYSWQGAEKNPDFDQACVATLSTFFAAYLHVSNDSECLGSLHFSIHVGSVEG